MSAVGVQSVLGQCVVPSSKDGTEELGISDNNDILMQHSEAVDAPQVVGPSNEDKMYLQRIDEKQVA